VPKARKRLDQYLNPRKKNPETVLLERGRFANRVFRFTTVAVLVTLFLAVLVKPPDVPSTVGLAMLFFVMTLLGGLCLHRLQPGVFDRPASFNKFIFLVVVAILLCHFVLGLKALLVPLAMIAMLVALAYTQDMAFLFVLGLAFFLGLISPRLDGANSVQGLIEAARTSNLPLFVRIDLPLILVTTAGSVTAILGVRHVREQSKPVIVGFYAGVVQAIVALAIELMQPGFDATVFRDPSELRNLLRDPGWAFAGGLISGGVVTCLLPALERFFDFVTERRLLELADPSNELLRVLRERAPGTFQHTLNVSQLAANAAEAIGGDRLLAEVGTLYHDIGKIFKPEYFVENMGDDKAIHDRLRPSMSKMIIVSHVKDGIIMAREERLPQKIIDMIPMHHGTTVVEYFYQKARRATETESAPSDTEYRYPGPRPRFREAGILMLSDMVEAIAKTEAEPNPARFRAMVHEQILKRLLDGQLDESDLTLNDLRVIEDSFVRTLTTMHHSRIKYPSAEKEKKDSKEPRDGAAPKGLPAAAGARK